MRPDGRRHTLRDLLREDTHFRFTDRMWRWALLSGAVLLLGVVGFAARGGLNLGIEFTGGTAWQVASVEGSPSVGALRERLRPLGLGNAKIVVLGGDGLRVQAGDLPESRRNRVTATIARFAGVPTSEVSVSEVSPTWGGTVSSKAIQALAVFFVLVAGYLSLRFEWKMAIAALAAVVHDLALTAGVYAVTGFEVTPATIIALLTILGFSLYDTVVVFDKIDENTPALATTPDLTYREMVNRSMNQVLVRSLNTSITTILPVAAVLFIGSGLLGAVGLRDFGLALFVGLLSGTYSSIFVAAPLVVRWKEREPRYRAIEDRIRSRGVRAAPAPPGARVLPGTAPAGVAGPVRGDGGPPAGPAPAPPERSAGEVVAAGPVITPRPRAPRRRKRR